MIKMKFYTHLEVSLIIIMNGVAYIQYCHQGDHPANVVLAIPLDWMFLLTLVIHLEIAGPK